MHKIMALDVGKKRIGIALSDYLQVTAKGLEYISRTPEEEALKKIDEIAKNNNVQKIVVGLPLNMDNTLGEQAKDCQDFAAKINGYEILFEDERLTSETAEENLRSKKIDFRKDKGIVDIESACIILEQYLARL